MKTVKLTRSRIKHSPVEVGCLLRSGSDSGLFVKVLEIVPNDYTKVLTRHDYPRNKDGSHDYDNPTTTKETQIYDKVVVETYAHVKCGVMEKPKRPKRRIGYISDYNTEVAYIETQAGSTHDTWQYQVAEIVAIKVTTDQAYIQGQQKRVRNEAYFKHQVKQREKYVQYRKENDMQQNWNPLDYDSFMADRAKWDNPYGFAQYDNALTDAWLAGHTAD
jgi:hypothetical protein